MSKKETVLLERLSEDGGQAIPGKMKSPTNIILSSTEFYLGTNICCRIPAMELGEMDAALKIKLVP